MIPALLFERRRSAQQASIRVDTKPRLDTATFVARQRPRRPESLPDVRPERKLSLTRLEPITLVLTFWLRPTLLEPAHRDCSHVDPSKLPPFSRRTYLHPAKGVVPTSRGVRSKLRHHRSARWCSHRPCSNWSGTVRRRVSHRRDKKQYLVYRRRGSRLSLFRTCPARGVRSTSRYSPAPLPSLSPRRRSTPPSVTPRPPAPPPCRRLGRCRRRGAQVPRTYSP